MSKAIEVCVFSRQFACQKVQYQQDEKLMRKAEKMK